MQNKTICEMLPESIIKKLPGFVYWKDSHLKYDGCNDAFAKLAGLLKPSIICGKNDHEIIQLSPNLGILINEDASLASNNTHDIITYEIELPYEDDVICLHVEKKIFLDEKGKFVGMISHATDITQQVERIYMLEKIIIDLPAYIFWKDKNLVYRGVSKKIAEAVNQKSINDIIGRTDYDFDWDKERIRNLHKIDQQILQGNEITHEETIPAQKKCFTMMTSKAPLKNRKGKIIGILGVSTDITERKNLEQSLEEMNQLYKTASQAKSEFIANMSHDIRTPITGMIGMMQQIMNTVGETKALFSNPSDNVNALLNKIEHSNQLLMQSTDQLLLLCNKILDTVCLESGKATAAIESFNLHELIEHNKQLLSPVAQHKNLTLSYRIEENVPMNLKGIYHYLERVLLNLVSNALKFTHQGFVNITLFCTDHSLNVTDIGESVMLQLSVEDSGIGIPNDKFEAIFENFSRLTSSYEGIYEGAGLGLYTVKQYVERMNGTITVNSTVGKGTCFIVTLPLTITEETGRKNTTSILPLQSPTHKVLDTLQSSSITDHPKDKMTNRAVILIVEDNPLAAKAVMIHLSPFDCQIEFATNGTEAVNMAQNNHYDLIFMDIGLPDFCGIETTKRIRKLNDQKKANVPIIALTGHAGTSEKSKEAKAAGMQAVLTKPARPSELETILQEYISEDKIVNQSDVPNTISDDLLDKSECDDIINWDNCVKLCSDDPDYTRELLSSIIEDLKINVKKTLPDMYERQDQTALRYELHRIRGGICYADLPQLLNALDAFHLAIHSESLDSKKVKTRYHKLMQAIDTLCTTWETHRF